MPWLAVWSEELVSALAGVARTAEPAPAQVVLSHDGGVLHLVRGAADGKASARGEWAGEVRVPASALLGLVRAPPPPGQLVLRVDGGELLVQGDGVDLAMPCEWSRGAAEAPFLAHDAPLLERWRLARTVPPADVDRLGLRSLVEDAVREVDDRVRRAAEALAPLGVGEDDVRALFDR